MDFILKHKIKISLAACMILSSILAFLCMDQGHNWGGDFAMYIQQSEALLNGTVNELYTTSKNIQDGSIRSIGPYLYPMGYPIILSPFIKIFGVNFLGIKVYSFLFFIFSLPILFYIIKQLNVSNTLALFAVFAVGLNFYFIRYADVIMSDFSFILISFISIYNFKSIKKPSYTNSLILGLLLYLTYFTRDIGIVLLLALAVYQFQVWRETKSFNWILMLIPYLVFFALKIIISNILPDGAKNHEDILAQANITSILNNIGYYFNQMGSLMIFPTSSIPTFVYTVLYSLFTIIVVWGMLKEHKNKLFLIVYIFASLGIYILWPVHQGVRFLFPIFPFVILFFALGLKHLLKPTLLKMALSFVIAIIFIQSLIVTKNYLTLDTNLSDTHEMRDMYMYIKQNVNDRETIVFRKPRVLNYFTNKQTIYSKYPLFLDNKDAKYVLADNLSDQQMADFEIIYKTKIYSLYKKK